MVFAAKALLGLGAACAFRIMVWPRLLEWLLRGPMVPVGRGWNRVTGERVFQIAARHQGEPCPARFERPLRVVTWNLLCPEYHRPQGGKESHDEAAWRLRLEEQLRLLEAVDADVLLLQEWWHASAGYRGRWLHWAAERSFSLFAVPRTGGKSDGVAVLLSPALGVEAAKLDAMSFNDWGDRVLQTLAFEAWGRQWLIANVHLTFPHSNSYDPPMRRHQGRKVAEALLPAGQGRTLILAGDFNGDASDAAVQRIVGGAGLHLHGVGAPTHRDHRGRFSSCDFVLTGPGLRAAGPPHLGGPEDSLDGSSAFCSDHRPLVLELLPDSG